jgi:MinD superfamily P-loop ATPase
MGDDRVIEFCETNDIDILLEVPFSRDIAETCSNGKLVIDMNHEFKNKLWDLYQEIRERVNNG